jgi:hypothetical protein
VGEHQKASIQSTMQHGKGIGILSQDQKKKIVIKSKIVQHYCLFPFSSLKKIMLAWEFGHDHEISLLNYTRYELP